MLEIGKIGKALVFATLTTFAANTGASALTATTHSSSKQAQHRTAKTKHRQLHKRQVKRVAAHKVKPAKRAKAHAKQQTKRSHVRQAKAAGAHAHPVGS